jgi:hypothetical protein
MQYGGCWSFFPWAQMRVALKSSSLNLSEGLGALRSTFHNSRSMWSRNFLASL